MNSEFLLIGVIAGLEWVNSRPFRLRSLPPPMRRAIPKGAKAVWRQGTCGLTSLAAVMGKTYAEVLKGWEVVNGPRKDRGSNLIQVVRYLRSLGVPYRLSFAVPGAGVVPSEGRAVILALRWPHRKHIIGVLPDSFYTNCWWASNDHLANYCLGAVRTWAIEIELSPD